MANRDFGLCASWQPQLSDFTPFILRETNIAGRKIRRTERGRCTCFRKAIATSMQCREKDAACQRMVKQYISTTSRQNTIPLWTNHCQSCSRQPPIQIILRPPHEGTKSLLSHQRFCMEPAPNKRSLGKEDIKGALRVKGQTSDRLLALDWECQLICKEQYPKCPGSFLRAISLSEATRAGSLQTGWGKVFIFETQACEPRETVGLRMVRQRVL